MNKKVPYIEQMEESECGLACLAMLLSYYKHDTSLSDLRDVYYSTKHGLSFYEIKKIAIEFKAQPKVYKIDQEKVNLIKEQNIFPCIAHWDQNHFVVIEKIKKNKAVIIDPTYGRNMIDIHEFQIKATGFFLCFENGDSLPYKRKSKGNITFLRKAMAQHKKRLIVLLTVSFFTIFISILIPSFMKWIIDNIFMDRQYNLLNTIGVLMLSLITLHFFISISRGYIIARFQKNIDKTLMQTFIHHLFHLPISFFESRSKGDLIYKTNSNVQIREILSEKLLGTFFDVLLVLILGIVLILQSLVLASIIIIASILLLLILLLTTNKSKYYTNNQIRTQIDTQSLLTEEIDLINDVKSMGLEQDAYSKWWGKFKQQIDVYERSYIWNNLLTTIFSSIQIAVPLVVLWIGISYVENGTITLGTLLFVMSMSGIYLTPVISIGNSYLEVLYLDSLFQRLNDVLHHKKEKNTNKIWNNNFANSINLKDVSFSHAHFEKPVLSHINMDITRGEKVGIIGNSGSGKSTLAKIIAGLLSPTVGDIYFDGQNYESINKQTLRKKFGVVLQDSKVFNDTIKENMTIKIAEAYENTTEDINYAAKLSMIYDDIQALPLKFETMLNESGKNLSGGQIQRILIGRAIYTNPDILILDEATSGLDIETEEKVLNNLFTHFSTVIFISHRLHIMKKMDKIYTLNNGKLSPASYDKQVQSSIESGKYFSNNIYENI